MASATYNNQGVFAETVVQGLNSHGGNINVSVNEDHKRRLDLLNWLSPISIEKHHEDLKSNLIVAKDSGSWFLNSRPYLNWVGPTWWSERVLWCPGLPGAGKTVMASLVVDQLLTGAAAPWQSHNDIVCWLYLGHEDTKCRPGALLGALLRHLVRACEDVPRFIQDLYRKHLEAKTSPTDETVMRCIVEVCQGKGNIFLVIDAMDEYPEAQLSHLFRYIRDMLTKLPALKILVTSRFIRTIQDELDSPRRHNIEAHDDDLVAFIHTQLGLDKYKHIRRLARAADGTESSLTKKIINTVILHSDKIFLLAKLQLDHIASKRTVAECLAALDEPPMNRDELYAKTVDRIMSQPDEDRGWAIRILTWVFCAERTLTIDELQVAIQREPFSGRTLDDSSKLSNEDIAEFCGGLISINKHTKSAVPFHYTIKEYFSQNQDRHFPNAHDIITSRCVSRLATIPQEAFSWTARENNAFNTLLRSYTLSRGLEDYECDRVLEYIELDRSLKDYRLARALKDYPLTRYSVEHLGHHVRQAEKLLTSARESLHRLSDTYTYGDIQLSGSHTSLSLETRRQLYDLVSDWKTRELLIMLLLYDGQYARSYNLTAAFGTPTAIHVAACLGLYETTLLLLVTHAPCAINDMDFNNEPGVMIAVRNDFSHLVTLFVQKGADVDLRTSTGREILLYTVRKGLTSIADTIIARAQDPARERKTWKLRNMFGPTKEGILLLCAAYHGNGTNFSRRLEDFIPTATKPAKEDGVLGCCLLLAAQKRDHRAVKLLITKGVDIDSADVAGWTALHRAAEGNDKALVKMLLKHNANVDIKNRDSMTAWGLTCGSKKHAEVEALLSKAKTDINAKGEHGITALYKAASAGHIVIVRRLLESGIDPNIATKYGWYPLHWAAGNGHYHCTKVLLEFEADPNLLSDTCETALDRAVAGKRDDIIALLFEHGAKRAEEVVRQPANTDSISLVPLLLPWRDSVDNVGDEVIRDEDYEADGMNPINIQLPLSATNGPVDNDASRLHPPQAKKKRWWKKISIGTFRASHTGKAPKSGLKRRDPDI